MNITALWQQLTSPNIQIETIEGRRRAHLSASLIIVLIPLFIIPELVRAVTEGYIPVYFFVTTIFLIVSYGLSRTRHYYYGIIITVTILTAVPFVGIIFSPAYDPQRLLYALIWVVPTMLLASLLLPLRDTIILVAVNIGLASLLPILVPEITYTNLIYSVGFLITVCALLLLAADIRRHDLLQITSQARTLAASEEKFRSLVENSPTGIFSVNQTGEFIYVNDQLCRILGYAKAEILSRTVQDFINNSEPPLLTNTLLPPRCECSILHPDGQRQVEVNSTAIMDGDGRLQTISQMLDITTRKEAEKAREQLISELDAFAHTVAHDLKNPLAIVSGFADLLHTNPNLAMDGNLPEISEAILSSATKMEAIIDDLLLLSSIRKMNGIEATPLPMEQIITEALSRIPHLIEKYNATIIMPDTWPVATGYTPWVEIIWSNYLSNAMKYGGRPATVTVGATIETQHMVRFWVRDNGNGLTQAEQDRLFTPFTRLGQNEAEGHGLGLSIVHRVASKLGGTVAVESKVGSGSEFSFTLPRSASHV